MDWSKAKTIFIITFLFLNFFLVYQLMEKQTDGDLNVLSQVTIHERLAEMHIEVTLSDLEEVKKGSPITGSTKSFNHEDLVEVLEGQTLEILNESLVYSILETPYKLSEQNMKESINAFKSDYVLNGEEYRVSYVDEEGGRVGLHQTYEGKTIEYYEEERYHLRLDINADLEIEAYHQSYMEISEHGREQEMLSPLKVIEILFNDQLIPANTIIDHVELSYYNLLELNGEFQIFGPMWKVQVNDKFYYVNAITGVILPINEGE